LIPFPVVVATGCVTALTLAALFFVQRESKRRYVASEGRRFAF
jgi:hypothetical protein